MQAAPVITTDIHKALAASLFNMAWTLIDKPDRTVEETDTMIHAAHASRYHWEMVDNHAPHHLARGEWQISRVYAIIGRAESALAHGMRCVAICEQNGIGDFDIAYAHEAVARAYAAAGNAPQFAEHYALAKHLGAAIADPEDLALLQSDLTAEPWYGMVPAASR